MADIKGIEHLVVSEWKSPDGAKALKVRVVQWIVDGEAKSIKLEKRHFFRHDGGEMRMGKCDGFNKQDLVKMGEHRDRIRELLNNPPPYTNEQAAADKAASDIEDPGF